MGEESRWRGGGRGDRTGVGIGREVYVRNDVWFGEN